MAKAFPQAPIFTSVYLPQNTFAEFKSLDVRTLPFAGAIKTERQFKLLFPLWLLLMQTSNYADFDVVLSSSTYLAKYIRPAPAVKHVCYLYAPFRLLWKPESYSRDSLPTRGAATGLVRRAIPLLRRWDVKRTRGIPRLATSCRNMADEINQVYGMPAEIINPPVEIPQVIPAGGRGDYYLSVSRLISHKRVDLSVQACTRLRKKLIVVGDGPEKERLMGIAGDTVHFAGNVSDEELQQYYREAKGFLFTSHEDYGIVPLEAQAWGTPVIAFGKGGALETIQEGVSGIYFNEQEVDSLEEAINKFETLDFSPEKIRHWVERFNPQNFTRRLHQFVEQLEG